MCEGGTLDLTVDREAVYITSGGNWHNPPCSCRVESTAPDNSPQSLALSAHFEETSNYCTLQLDSDSSPVPLAYSRCSVAMAAILNPHRNKSYQLMHDFNPALKQTEVCIKINGTSLRKYIIRIAKAVHSAVVFQYRYTSSMVAIWSTECLTCKFIGYKCKSFHDLMKSFN